MGSEREQRIRESVLKRLEAWVMNHDGSAPLFRHNSEFKREGLFRVKPCGHFPGKRGLQNGSRLQPRAILQHVAQHNVSEVRVAARPWVVQKLVALAVQGCLPPLHLRLRHGAASRGGEHSAVSPAASSKQT